MLQASNERSATGTNRSIRELAKKTGIPAGLFHEAMELPKRLYMHQIRTMKQAVEVWQTSPPGSYEQRYAYMRMVSLSKTVEEAAATHLLATDDELKIFALQRIIELHSKQ